MATKIGIKTVEAMQPQTILWDGNGKGTVHGFNARRQFSDAVTYSVFYRTIDGQQRWHKIGRHGVFTPEQARSEAQRILRDVALGRDPSGERQALRNAMTIEQLCNEYVSDMQSGKVNGKKISTIKTDISRIATHIKPALGKRKVTGFTQEDVEQFMRDLPAGSARRVTGLLGAIFSYSVKRKLRPDNPVHGLDKPAETKRTRRLSEGEYAQLARTLDNGDNAACDVFRLLAVSGWRSSEAKNLKWSELDLERRVATLGDTKSGLSVRPLSSAAIDIIKRQPQKGTFVFDYQRSKPISNLTPHWNKLGMADDVTPHTLRHSLASLAADMGLPDHTISGLLGHARQGITSRYMHLGDRALIDASDLVANETLRLMGAQVATSKVANPQTD